MAWPGESAIALQVSVRSIVSMLRFIADPPVALVAGVQGVDVVADVVADDDPVAKVVEESVAALRAHRVPFRLSSRVTP